MSIVLSHPTGNEFFRAAAKGFYEAGELESLYTAIASFPGTMLHKIGSLQLLQDVRRRTLDRNFKPVTHTYPLKEAGRLLSVKLNLQKFIQHEKGIFSVDAVYKDLDRHVAARLKHEQAKGAAIVYAYEDGAAYSFKEAGKLGMKSVYDLPIGYWQAMHDLVGAEKELNPGWASTLDGLKNSAGKLARKDEEISRADAIVVASSFTADSLHNFKGALPRICIVPYGFPPAQPKTYRCIQSNDKIRLLFVGGLSQRKGLSYLFKAVEGFESSVSLTVIGRGAVNKSKILKDNLARHTWIETLPHKEVLRQMQAHDILVFPSLFEGFGQVITEAMAQGTPVITTERTAGADIIKHEQNGWLVKAGSVDDIKNLLQQIIHRPEMIETTGRLALKTAAGRPWKMYEEELVAAVKGL